ncbi:PIN domain protein [bacterium]|nr:PIN domain protein [bacterium]
MKKMLIYIDTSVIGGCFDEEFEDISLNLIDMIKYKKIRGVISDISIREVSEAPDFIVEHFETYQELLEIVNITDEMIQLADSYLNENVITEKFYEDALHIACATIRQVDLMVSWNFKHIVNFNRIIQYNSVNLKNGYKTLQIYSPLEVVFDEEK